MLALQRVSRQPMVELLNVPLDQGEILPIVIGMTLAAPLARARFDVVRRVQPFTRSNPRRNLRVAFETPVGWLSCREAMALNAVGCATQ